MDAGSAPEVLRPLDGVEYPLYFLWISVSDVFDHVDIAVLEKKLESLQKYTPFNLSVVTVDGYPHWARIPFKVVLEEIEWENLDELRFGDYIQVVDGSPLYHVGYSEKDGQTMITLRMSHVVSDGRTIFEAYDLIRAMIEGRTLEYPDSPLCEYGQRCLFTLPDSAYKRPKLWDAERGKMLPDLTPTKITSTRYSYPCEPVEKFAKYNHITYQGILMAIMNKVFMKYNHIPDSVPITTYCPTDTRTLEVAKDDLRIRHFFNNAGASLCATYMSGNMLEDIKACSREIYKIRHSNDPAIQLGLCGVQFDRKTRSFVGFVPPDIHNQFITVATNIGFVNGNDPGFKLHNVANEDYSVVLYSYHTKKTFYMVLVRPLELPEDLVKMIEDEIGATIKWIENESKKL